MRYFSSLPHESLSGFLLKVKLTIEESLLRSDFSQQQAPIIIYLSWSWLYRSSRNSYGGFLTYAKYTGWDATVWISTLHTNSTKRAKYTRFVEFPCRGQTSFWSFNSLGFITTSRCEKPWRACHIGPSNKNSKPTLLEIIDSRFQYTDGLIIFIAPIAQP